MQSGQEEEMRNFTLDYTLIYCLKLHTYIEMWKYWKHKNIFKIKQNNN